MSEIKLSNVSDNSFTKKATYAEILNDTQKIIIYQTKNPPR